MHDSTTRRPPPSDALITRALVKAHEQARAGNLPALLSSDARSDARRLSWAITSRTQAETVYRVDVIADATGVVSHCQCAASHVGRVCWHRAAVWLALFGDIDHLDCRADGTPGRTPAPPS